MSTDQPQSFWERQYLADTERQAARAAERGVTIVFQHDSWFVYERGRKFHTALASNRSDAARIAWALASTYH